MSDSTPGSLARHLEQIIASIKALNLAERTRLFKALEYRPALFDGTDYVIVHASFLDLFENTINSCLEHDIEVSGHIRDLRSRLVRRNRQPDEIRLERGKIVLQANRDGVS